MSSDYSQLADVADVIDSSHQTPTYVEIGVPMVRVTDVKYGELSLSSARHVSVETFRDYSRRYKAKPKDIIISRVGSYGNTAWVAETEFCLGQNVASISPKAIDPRYLFFALNSRLIWSQIESKVVGSTQKTLSLKAIRELHIPRLGDVTESSIGKLLGALDDRISLLRETNATLEAIAQALFKSWFVDFDPVRAKQAGRAPEGMDEATAALFPDSFEESELGLVPKGWRVVTFGELCTVTIGGLWGKDTKEDADLVPAISLRGVDLENLRSIGFAIDAPVRWVKPAAMEKRRVSEREVLIASSGAGPCGRPLWAGADFESVYGMPVIFSNFVKRFDCGNPARAIYIDRLLAEMRDSREIWNYINGTSIPNLDDKLLLATKKVIVPSDDALAAFEQLARTIYSKLYSQQAQTLATLRDTLLPRLISGQLRLPEAEALIEDATA